jgi:prepilin-type N-terminal cleavage/methylation domain-containing protein
MKGGKNKQPLGYTIIEVMIVLAVSGLMFVIAASFINGKQQQASFKSGINQLASQIQDVIEQVTDGKYSDIPINCVNNAGTLNLPKGAQQQGTNQDCVFVGKFMHFDVGGIQNKYEIFSLANLRDTTSLAGATPITPYAFPFTGGYELTTKADTPQSLNVKSVTLNGTISIYGFGFTQSQGTPIGRTGYVSGGQTIGLVYALTLSSTASESTAAQEITSGGLGGGDSVSMCVTDGGHYAQILLGGKDTNGNQQSQLTVSVQQLGNTAC